MCSEVRLDAAWFREVLTTKIQALRLEALHPGRECLHEISNVQAHKCLGVRGNRDPMTEQYSTQF